MSGRRVGVVASVSAGLAVLALGGGVASATPATMSFATGASLVAVVALVVGLLSGFGAAVACAYLLAGAAAVASILSDDAGPARSAIIGLVLLASSELARVSLDARQPCRFDRGVLGGIGARLGLTLVAVGGLLLVLDVVDGLSVSPLLVPAGVAGAVAVAGALAGAGRVRMDGDGRPMVVLAVLALVVLALLGAVAVEQGRDDAPIDEETAVVAPPPADAAAPTPAAGDLDERAILTMRLVVIVLVVVLALLLGGALLIPSADLTLDPYELDPDDDLVLAGGAIAELQEIADEVGAEAAVAAIDDALAELTGDLAPGLAVRVAYDRVQSGFGRVEVARGPSESETEYLGRLLTDLGVSADAMTRLTDLFEQARFSEHRIDEPMRAEAVAAFEQVRGELLAGAAPARPGAGS